MNKTLVAPFIILRKEIQRFQFKRNVKKNTGDIKIVVGSCGIYQEEWIPTEAYFLNLLKEGDWIKYFKEGSISNILAEHVWEHLSYENGCIAARTCFKFLKEGGGRLRIAVPDGFHPSKDYINYVRPGGVGIAADDHKILYNCNSIKEMLAQAGFKVVFLEYFDEGGIFHRTDWDKKDGFINRSFKFDKRNADGNPNYTSIIVDAIKQ